MMTQTDNQQIKVNINGKLEDWRQGQHQSDGSEYFMPKSTRDPNHEHYFELKDPGDRQVICQCGMGGMFYPHNAKLIDGHIYNLNDEKII